MGVTSLVTASMEAGPWGKVPHPPGDDSSEQRGEGDKYVFLGGQPSFMAVGLMGSLGLLGDSQCPASKLMSWAS